MKSKFDYAVIVLNPLLPVEKYIEAFVSMYYCVRGVIVHYLVAPMSNADELKFKLWDAVDSVKDLIKRWNPKNCKSEKDYEKSLLEFFRTELPNVKITPQYAVDRTKADMLIGEKIILEMKKNLNATSAYQRLSGQVKEYMTWDKHIVLLLIGKTDPDFKQRLEKDATQHSGLFRGITIIQK